MRSTIGKLAKLDFLLQNYDATIGQLAIRFCLAPDVVASCTPTITSSEMLDEYVAAAEIEPLAESDLAELDRLYASNFGVEENASPDEIQCFEDRIRFDGRSNRSGTTGRLKGRPVRSHRSSTPCTDRLI